MDRLNILFTSVGRRVELVRAFRCAFNALGVDGRISATDVNPLAPALQCVDAAHIVPPSMSGEFVEKLFEVIQTDAIQVVFPLIDPDIRVLASTRPEIESRGARLAVIPLEFAEITADKWRTHLLFTELGVPTPKSWLPEVIAVETCQLPLFIKPRYGSASQHTFRICSRSELEFFAKYVPNPIIQQLVTGAEITNDVVCDLTGDVLSLVSRKRIRVHGGEVLIGVTMFDEEITKWCLRIARALSARGPITVQCIMQDGHPVFTEVNARFGGGFPLGIAAGSDSIRLLLARLMGKAIEVPPLGSYKKGLYLSRFFESMFLSEDEQRFSECVGARHLGV